MIPAGRKTGDFWTQQVNLCCHSDFCTAQVLLLASEIAPWQRLKETCPLALPPPSPHPSPAHHGFQGTETFIIQTQKVRKVEQAFPQRAGTRLFCSKQDDPRSSPSLSDSLVLRPRAGTCPVLQGQRDKPQPRPRHVCGCKHTAASVQILLTITLPNIRVLERDESPWLEPGACLAAWAALPGHQTCLWSSLWAEGQ